MLAAWDTLGFQPTCLVKAHLWACLQKSSSKPCLLMRLDLSMLDTLKKKKRKKQRPFGLEWRAEAREPYLAILVWVPESKTQRKREIQLEWCSSSEEIEWNIVGVWESEKEKRRHFFLLKLHARKINWWNFHGVFKCYNHGDLEYSEEDFATGFVVRLYLLLEIYLLYIQFIMDTSLA